jgi:hypothetical protein
MEIKSELQLSQFPAQKIVKDSLDAGAWENQVVCFDGISRHLATGTGWAVAPRHILPQFESNSDV